MKTMYVNFEGMQSAPFWSYVQTIYSRNYFGYTLEIEEQKYYSTNGETNGYYAIFLLKYNDNNMLEETYVLNTVPLDGKKLWAYITTLELEVASSNFQYLESLGMFQNLVKYEIGGFAELEGIDTETGDLWLFIPIDNHHVEAWKKLYIGQGRYESSFEYVETINWWNMTPLERKKALGWAY